MTPEDQAALRSRRETADDICNLVSIFNEMGASSRDLLEQAVVMLAERRVRGNTTRDGKEYAATDWLRHLARESFSGSKASDLLEVAFMSDDGAREQIFGEDELSWVLGSLTESAESLYERYMSYHRDTYAIVPKPADFFELKCPPSWVQDDRESKEDWQEHIRTLCIDEFYKLVWFWRLRFFRTLIGTFPETPR